MANNPNILSNNLDQAPKNTNTRYQARLDAINEEIEQAFNAMHISGDPEIENWLSEHQNDIPLHKLNTLKAGESIAFEIKREKVEEIRGGWNEAPSAPKGINETIFKNTKYKLSKNHQEPLKNGEKATYILIQKEHNPQFPKNQDFKVSAIEFMIPGKGALLSAGLVYEKQLEGEEFTKATADIHL